MRFCSLFILLSLCWFLRSGFGNEEGIVFFEKKVRPILVTHCYECHSERSDKVKGGLLLDTRMGIRKGGDLGPAVVPKNLSDSLLVEAVRWENDDMQMPPKKKLADSEIKILEQWIRMGAPDPRDGITVVKDEIDLQAGREFWAFQPFASLVPSSPKDNWSHTPIDRLLFQGYQERNLKPAPDAKKETLLRRAFFDLIGLPPSKEELNKFMADDSPIAFAKIVNRLLESRQFGETWGRHWLDVARFAESNGMERNAAFPHAWRYRDYVIKSFNQDKPFDRFIKEQIAGDLLSQNPDDDSLIATGFLAIGPKPLNNRNKAEFTMDLVDEQIDATTRAFMGLTVACARCHDHKFDPVSTEDYYSMAGIFRSTQALFGGGGGSGNNGFRQVTKLVELQQGRKPPAKKVNYASLIAEGQKRVKALNKKLAELKKKAKGKQKDSPEIKKLTASVKRVQAEIKKNRALDAKSKGQSGPLAMGLRDNANPVDVKVHLRGNVATLGKVAPRGFPDVFQFSDIKVNRKQSGRLQLANWIIHPDNPLTARVTANRIWHHLFGRGIVRTVDNFGETGDRPSNQPLLDHLATRLVENGWSIKKLIREIMLSRAYQMSSFHDIANAERDPDNAMFWKMNQRRLSAENIRDAILTVSGRLNLAPPQGSIVQEMNGDIGRDIKSLEKIRKTENNKRSVYLPVARQAVPESLKAFDFAEPSIMVGKRDVTTVPAQALFLLNGKFVTDHAKSFALRLTEFPFEQRIGYAFQMLYARAATGKEIERCMKFMESCVKSGQSWEDAWISACQALLASAEFRYVN